MKHIKLFIVTLAVIAGTSCTLDLRENPNVVQVGQQSPSLVLNTMQLNLAGLFQTASTIGMQQTRLQNGAGTDYSNSVRPETFNGMWSTAYANILVEGNALIQSAEAQGFYRHAGIARILMAYTMVLLVDFFGDVPYSEAIQGLGNLNPQPDDDQAVYAAAADLLITARDRDLVTPLTNASTPGLQNPVAPAITDFFYGTSAPGSNYVNWRKLANSILLKMYLNTEDLTALNAVIAHSAGLITAQNENFIFRYSTNISAPDSRHPRFIANYPGGGGNYMSNWLIWHMFHGYNAQQAGAPGDPRIRFYFYRQRLSNSTDANEIRCLLSPEPPDHYPKSTGSAIIDNGAAGRAPLGEQTGHPTITPAHPAWGRTFCYPTNVGYWGRDHQDNQGIPPDGLARTAWGAYPAGGRFDANNGATVTAVTGTGNDKGMRGAGFQPIMMRSYVQFMLAEAQLRLGATTPSSARVHYENGIRQSMQDVRDWAVNGTYNTTSVAPAPTEASVINSFYPTASNRTVLVASTANIVSLNGLLTIDGETLNDGDRVLVKNQSTASQNGIYVASSGAWTRATDSDEASELIGQVVRVTNGTVNGGTYWRQTATGTITIGTTAISYAVTGLYPVDVDNYVASALHAFDNAPNTGADSRGGAMGYIAREYWIALFGNGVEAYNLYRRTGLPKGMQPAQNPVPGDFPLVFWYPANAANLNRNVDQRTSLTERRPFWVPNTFNLNF